MVYFRYRCTECGKSYDRDQIRYLCPICSGHTKKREPLKGVLEVEFDFVNIRKLFDINKPNWSLLSAVEAEYYPNYPIGNTPIVECRRLAQSLHYKNLLIKNEGLNPSGSLKDRASFLLVAEANRLGEDRVVTASTGNAASALAAVCAAAGKKAVIFVPKTAPKAKIVQMLLYGAEVVTLNGTYDDAVSLSLAYTKAYGGLNRNTAYHPLTIEGKKTVALEMYIQLGKTIPDAVIVPVGDGVIISGIYKGFKDLLLAGLIRKLPRLVCVQAESSDAIHHYITTGKYRNAISPSTVADSISVSAPSNAHMAKNAVKESEGFSVTVSDNEILDAQALLARTTGIFAEPAAAAAVAGTRIAASRLENVEKVIILITGHGLKDIEAPLERIRIPKPVDPTLQAVERRLH